MSIDIRRRELARIHLLAKTHGMDTADTNPMSDYRSMLWATVRARSAGDLDAAGRKRVIGHLESLLPKAAHRRAHSNRPQNLNSLERGPQLAKIEAILAEAGRPWTYADAMARKMFGVERLAFCNCDHLRRIIAALVYDQRRRRRRPAQ